MTPWFGGVETVQGATPEWATLPFAGVTLLGEVWVLVVVLSLSFWFTGRREIAALFGVALAALSLTLILKLAFGLPRPTTGPPVSVDAVATFGQPLYERELSHNTYGLPSGHTVGATVTWGALALILDWGTRRHRVMLAGLVVVLVGLSRIVLGVHYPIDVVAGGMLGLAILAGTVWLFRRTADPATPALSIAVLVSALAVVITGESHAANATGAAVGGLLAWLLTGPSTSRIHRTQAHAVLAAGGLGLIIGVGLTLGSVAGSTIGPYLGTAIVAAAVLVLPNAIAGREIETGQVFGGRRFGR